MRRGQLWETMLVTFDGCAAAGAELLSIESVGGKEVHDDALQMCDIAQVVFALCIMGVRDMRFLWTHLKNSPTATPASIAPATPPAALPTRRWSSPSRR